MCLRFHFLTHHRVCILHFLKKSQIRCTLLHSSWLCFLPAKMPCFCGLTIMQFLVAVSCISSYSVAQNRKGCLRPGSRVEDRKKYIRTQPRMPLTGPDSFLVDTLASQSIEKGGNPWTGLLFMKACTSSFVVLKNGTSLDLTLTRTSKQ